VSLPPTIPIFPLPNVVLFPHVSLPLHIFEPRYRKMVADALDSHRTIGMVLLRPGWEEDYAGRPPVYERGCAGTIIAAEELPDGRYNIVLKGALRFLIREEHAGEPYRLARVEPAPEAAGEAGRLEEARGRVLGALGSQSEAHLRVLREMPDDVLVNGLAQSLGLEPVERQSLLDCDTIAARFARLVSILEYRALAQGAPSPTGPPTLH
jgi:Lon protease-like protein